MVSVISFCKLYVPGANYTNGNNVIMPGYIPNTLANPDLKWESTSQLNVAADIKFLNNFNLTVDYYKENFRYLKTGSDPGYVE